MRRHWVLAVGMLLGLSATALAGPQTLEYGDGKEDGKKSLGGSGEMIRFSLPSGNWKVKGIRIHASRYGMPQAPDEEFLIYVLSEDAMDIVHTETAPYKLFDRGDQKWVKVKFKKPVEVPASFWIALDFRAHKTKGVYVSFDTSTGGQYSKKGLPGQGTSDVDFAGDWMIQVDLTP